MTITIDRFSQPPAEARARQVARRARDELVSLAQHLPKRDRWLVEQVYVEGLSLGKIARAAGYAPPHQLRNRERRLARQLESIAWRVRRPAFQLLVRRPELVPHRARAAARAVLVDGRPLRHVARAHRLRLHQVRARVQTVRDLARIL